MGWAVAYGLAHHLGLLPDGLGDAGGGTRWADWLDLLVPYAVVGLAWAALARARTDHRGWAAGLTGGVLYVQGHGVHLAANSIGAARGDAAPVHLWDEVVGHALWYAGFAVLAAVLARSYRRTRLTASPAGLLLAVLTGVTWATNALGADGLAPYGLVGALVLAAYGRRLGGSAGLLLVAAFLPGAVVITVALLLG